MYWRTLLNLITNFTFTYVISLKMIIFNPITEQMEIYQFLLRMFEEIGTHTHTLVERWQPRGKNKFVSKSLQGLLTFVKTFCNKSFHLVRKLLILIISQIRKFSLKWLKSKKERKLHFLWLKIIAAKKFGTDKYFNFTIRLNDIICFLKHPYRFNIFTIISWKLGTSFVFHILYM